MSCCGSVVWSEGFTSPSPTSRHVGDCWGRGRRPSSYCKWLLSAGVGGIRVRKSVFGARTLRCGRCFVSGGLLGASLTGLPLPDYRTKSILFTVLLQLTVAKKHYESFFNEKYK